MNKQELLKFQWQKKKRMWKLDNLIINMIDQLMK
jgi:hypothetical protein